MSVLEMTVALSVFLVVVAAMLTLTSVVQRTAVRQEKRNQVTGEMRLTMERLTKELRQATTIYDTSGTSVLDMETYINGNAVRVIYQATGTTFTRTVGTTTKTFVTGLTSTQVFTYTPTITGATDVVIDLRARPARFSTDPGEVRVTSQVRLRNRRAA